MKDDYKQEFLRLPSQELRDIISGRFRATSEDEIAAATELLEERKSKPIEDNKNLALSKIQSSSIAILLEIIKNPHLWDEEVVKEAEAEILFREQELSPLPQGQSRSQSKGGKITPLKVFLSMLSLIAFAIFIKLAAGAAFVVFILYTFFSYIYS